MSRLQMVATVCVLAVVLGATGVVTAVAFPMIAGNPIEVVATPTNQGEAVQYDENDPSMTEPVVVDKVSPTYPEEARKNKLSGSVICQATISAAGDVTEVEIVKTTDAVFNQSVIDAVGQWKFEPSTKDGKAIAVRYKITIKFNLR